MKDKEIKDDKSDMKDDKEIQYFKNDKILDLMNEIIFFWLKFNSINKEKFIGLKMKF